MTKLPLFRIALGFAVFYVAVTLIVQFIPLPGKISWLLFSIGEFVAVGYWISILASVVALFFWRSCKHAWAPLLVSALTFAFLYFFWYVKVPTDARIFNDNGGMFYYHTKLELPLRTSSLKEYDSGPSFFGDGTTELSFKISKENLHNWIIKSGVNWKKGPYYEDGSTLNQYDKGGQLLFRDSADVEYSTIDRSPVGPRECHRCPQYDKLYDNLC